MHQILSLPTSNVEPATTEIQTTNVDETEDADGRARSRSRVVLAMATMRAGGLAALVELAEHLNPPDVFPTSRSR
jgi:hypothetical protein